MRGSWLSVGRPSWYRRQLVRALLCLSLFRIFFFCSRLILLHVFFLSDALLLVSRQELDLDNDRGDQDTRDALTVRSSFSLPLPSRPHDLSLSLSLTPSHFLLHLHSSTKTFSPKSTPSSSNANSQSPTSESSDSLFVPLESSPTPRTTGKGSNERILQLRRIRIGTWTIRKGRRRAGRMRRSLGLRRRRPIRENWRI